LGKKDFKKWREGSGVPMCGGAKKGNGSKTKVNGVARGDEIESAIRGGVEHEGKRV